MEASFKSRVEQAFGALLGSSSEGLSAPQRASVAASSSAGGAAASWSVSEVAIPCNQGSRTAAEESSGSESDEPCAARYEKFVKLAKRARRRQPNDDDEFLDDLNELDDVDEGRAPKRRRGEEPADPVSAENGEGDADEEEECRQVRLMVGMDDTLDFEEEEDEYDKVAVGREGAGERVYMSEITTGGTSDLSPHTPLPVASVSSSDRRKFRRDSRANHAAAAARLEEDDRLATIKTAEVGRMLSLSNSSGSASHTEPSSGNVPDHQNGSPHPFPALSFEAPLFSGVIVLCPNGSPHRRGSSSLKPIIKPAQKSSENASNNGKTDAERAHQNASEGEDSKDSRGGLAGPTQSPTRQDGSPRARIENRSKAKKVRFAVEDDVIPEKEPVYGRRNFRKAAPRPLSKKNRGPGRVPDHVLNPSKYTHYTLDWSDEDGDENKANLTAFQAAQAITRRAREEEEAEQDAVMGNADLPKSITFTPRSGGGGGGANKSNAGEAKPVSSGAGLQQSQALVSFAEEVVLDNNSPRPPEDTSHLTPAADANANASTESSSSRAARIFRKRARDEDKDDTDEKHDAS